MRNLSQPFAYFVYSNGDLCGATTLTTVEPRAAHGRMASDGDVGDSARRLNLSSSSTGSACGIAGGRCQTDRVARPSSSFSAKTESRWTSSPLRRARWLRCALALVSRWRRSAGSCRAARRTRRLVRDLDAELWLVHRRPDGVENVQRLEIHAGQAGMGFFFRPTRVETTTATLMIEVAGDIRSEHEPERSCPGHRDRAGLAQC